MCAVYMCAHTGKWFTVHGVVYYVLGSMLSKIPSRARYSFKKTVKEGQVCRLHVRLWSFYPVEVTLYIHLNCFVTTYISWCRRSCWWTWESSQRPTDNSEDKSGCTWLSYSETNDTYNVKNVIIMYQNSYHYIHNNDVQWVLLLLYIIMSMW